MKSHINDITLHLSVDIRNRMDYYLRNGIEGYSNQVYHATWSRLDLRHRLSAEQRLLGNNMRTERIVRHLQNTTRLLSPLWSMQKLKVEKLKTRS